MLQCQPPLAYYQQYQYGRDIERIQNWQIGQGPGIPVQAKPGKYPDQQCDNHRHRAYGDETISICAERPAL